MTKRIAIGFIAGLASGFFASGGGLLLVPAFVYFFYLSDKEARATSIYAILPMVIVSGFFYYTGVCIDWNLAIQCSIGGIIGACLGSKLLSKMPTNFLKISFLIFLIYIAIRMLK